jgi:hypothetical protein
LTITKSGNDNVLSWPGQTGASGYQVWRHTSPWIKLADVPAGNTTYTDKSAPAGASYQVTVFSGAHDLEHGYFTDLNTQTVPGYTGVPSGSAAPARGLVPGFEAVALVAGLAAAAIVLRRRKDA